MGNVGKGTDTAGSVQQATFNYLLKVETVYMRRLAEVIDKSRTKGMFSTAMSYAESQKLPYLQDVYSLPPVVPEESLTVAGHFTRGTTLSINLSSFIDASAKGLQVQH